MRLLSVDVFAAARWLWLVDWMGYFTYCYRLRKGDGGDGFYYWYWRLRWLDVLATGSGVVLQLWMRLLLDFILMAARWLWLVDCIGHFTRSCCLRAGGICHPRDYLRWGC